MKIVKTAAFQPIKIILENCSDAQMMDAVLIAAEDFIRNSIYESLCGIPITDVCSFIEIIKNSLTNTDSIEHGVPR
jgi:hypothetical protein